MRQLGTVVLIGLTWCSCATPSGSPESGRIGLVETRELVRIYQLEVLSSTTDFDRPSVLKTLREEQPTSQLLELFKERDPVIERLGGSSWGMVCMEVGSEPFVDPLIYRLSDPNPRSRSFACEALGQMGVLEGSPARRAVPDLIAILEDQEPVAGYSGSPPVAAFAASALAFMGRAEGVGVLLTLAETLEYWHLSYGQHFRSLSGEDYGTDLDAWKLWFAENDSLD
ncbi:MAG: hypothetical protein ACI87A_003372 [Planctomycetota bacterium]|jgi:hypothetical protein